MQIPATSTLSDDRNPKKNDLSPYSMKKGAKFGLYVQDFDES